MPLVIEHRDSSDRNPMYLDKDRNWTSVLLKAKRFRTSPAGIRFFPEIVQGHRFRKLQPGEQAYTQAAEVRVIVAKNIEALVIPRLLEYCEHLVGRSNTASRKELLSLVRHAIRYVDRNKNPKRPQTIKSAMRRLELDAAANQE